MGHASQAADDRAAEADVVSVVNATGRGNFVLVCEHASPHIPDEFNDLGLEPAGRESHIVWDPGAFAVALVMSASLDSPLVSAQVSRIVYDCNRAPGSHDAIPDHSDIYPVPGNREMTDDQRRARHDRFYTPFRDTLADLVETRMNRRRPPALLTIHSFTPVYQGKQRDIEIGILHDRDTRLADPLLDEVAGQTRRIVRRNEPYSAADGVTHTLLEHAIPRNLMNAMIEIRSDLIEDPGSQRNLAGSLAVAAQAAYASAREPATPGSGSGHRTGAG